MRSGSEAALPQAWPAGSPALFGPKAAPGEFPGSLPRAQPEGSPPAGRTYRWSAASGAWLGARPGGGLPGSPGTGAGPGRAGVAMEPQTMRGAGCVSPSHEQTRFLPPHSGRAEGAGPRGAAGLPCGSTGAAPCPAKPGGEGQGQEQAGGARGFPRPGAAPPL